MQTMIGNIESGDIFSSSSCVIPSVFSIRSGTNGVMQKKSWSRFVTVTLSLPSGCFSKITKSRNVRRRFFSSFSTFSSIGEISAHFRIVHGLITYPAIFSPSSKISCSVAGGSVPSSFFKSVQSSTRTPEPPRFGKGAAPDNTFHLPGIRTGRKRLRKAR